MSKYNSREIALKILYQILEEGAYANLALDKALFSCRNLDARDKGLITEIVYGTVRNLGKLDYILNQFAKTPVHKMDVWTRNILRMSLYQILLLEKVPDSAAVDEGVKLSKRHGHADKFVNAVLRNYLRGKDRIVWPNREQDPERHLVVRYSIPTWMAKRFLKAYGLEQAEALCEYFNAPAPIWIRTNTLRISKKDLKARLEAAGYEVEESRHVPEGLRILNGAPVHQMKEFQAGYFTVQDESSMLVALAAEPAGGDKVLDVCSAPGGKATHMAQLMKNKGQIYACDIHKHRLDLIGENCKRLGVENVQLVLQDGTKLTERWKDPFDVILCDVPCSGLGVLGRRADARWSKETGQITELCRIQKKILDQAAQLVKPGGTLIYSTCTITDEENIDQVRAFLERHPEFYLDETLPDCWLDMEKGQSGYAQFLPFEDGMDGFFIARMMRKED